MTSILKADTIQDTDGNNIINESGNTITIGASGDTTNIVGTLQNNGAAVGGTNTPAFSANKTSGTISFSINTFAKLTLDNELYDTASAYDTSNGRFTVPSGQGGKYHFSAHCVPYEQANIAMTGHNLAFYKNGSLEIYVPYLYDNVTGYYKGMSISADLDLSAGDYVEFYVRVYAGSGTGRAEVGASYNRFSGFKLIE